MTIAVIICTMNRAPDLRQALEALHRCEPPPARIVVSDDSPASERSSEGVCESFPAVTYRVGPRRGLAANRNAAIENVGTDWIHFIDDDVIVPGDLYATFSAIAASADSCLVSGIELRFEGGSLKPQAVSPPHAGFWAHLVDRPHARNCVVINASFFPASLFRAARFDEFLKYGCEESDITCAALALGFRLRYEPSLIVSHYPSPVNRDVYKTWVVASQIYAGLKRQWCYRRSLVRTVGFAAIAAPRLVLYHARRSGIRGIHSSAVQAFRGLRQFLRSCRTGFPQGVSVSVVVREHV